MNIIYKKNNRKIHLKVKFIIINQLFCKKIFNKIIQKSPKIIKINKYYFLVDQTINNIMKQKEKKVNNNKIRKNQKYSKIFC